jgi:para-nitrobenzyl esterase
MRYHQVTTMNVRTAIAFAWCSSLGACSSRVAANILSPTSNQVTVDAGTIEGRMDSARHVLVFKGIPYAAPPVGDLRWRAPVLPAHWAGVRQADALGHNCMQQQPYGDIDPYQAGVSEDCLNLNVWTSSLDGRRPVMVWIHGRGFFAGFGGEDRHDGSVLTVKGAVGVSLNYRLGAFGFLAHPALAAESEARASGNYGIMDQVAALDWVRRNIARFGGDPARVTIFGESAGGMSVGVLVASPLAKGLFQRAIIESGTGTGSFTQRSGAAEAAGIQLASALRVDGSGTMAATRLRASSAYSILAASSRLAGNPGSPVFWPNVDGKVLAHSVDSTLALGLASEVPVIVGSNADEPASAFGAPSRAFARLMSARDVPV